MSNEEDDKGSPGGEWPPKRSGRRKIDQWPAQERAETSVEGTVQDGVEDTVDEEAPASESFELPGGVQLDEALRQAYETEEPGSVDVLRRVQGALRERSGGKFYADGWSTTRHPPFGTFFVTSLMMLAIVAIIYAILAPLVGEPIQLPQEPAPVNVGPVLKPAPETTSP